jgi:hypothetical protein
MDKLDGSTPMDKYNAGHADRVYNVVAAYLDTSFS